MGQAWSRRPGLTLDGCTLRCRFRKVAAGDVCSGQPDEAAAVFKRTFLNSSVRRRTFAPKDRPLTGRYVQVSQPRDINRDAKWRRLAMNEVPGGDIATSHAAWRCCRML